MPILRSTIRPAPGGDGPFFVVTENDGTVANVTLGLATITAALNQARDDQGTIISGGGLIYKGTQLTTQADSP